MNNIIINADTDSVMIAKPNGEPWSEEEQKKFLKDLNSQFPELINFEHDGIFKSVVVIRSKNYAMLDEKGKIKLKGSSIKTSSKEPAMKEMMEKIIEAMLYGKQDQIENIYISYVKEALNVKDISRWASKKTITEAVTKCGNPKETVRKQERDIWDAIKDEDDKQEGNKIYLYPVILGEQIIPGGVSEKTGKPLKDKVVEITGLKMTKNWSGDHNVLKLVERCYATLEIFESVLDMKQFINYSKKKLFLTLLDE